MTTPERMYLIDGNKRGHDDYVTLYETDIEPNLTEDLGPHLRPIEVEEWTVKGGRDLMPSADIIVERITEDLYEEAGDFAGWAIEAIADDDAVTAAAEKLLDAMARHCHYFLADKRVATHTISWDVGSEPLWNGERMYPKHYQAG